jgi:hypothetical protein
MDHKELIPTLLFFLSELIPLITKKDVGGVADLLVKTIKGKPDGSSSK